MYNTVDPENYGKTGILPGEQCSVNYYDLPKELRDIIKSFDEQGKDEDTSLVEANVIYF